MGIEVNRLFLLVPVLWLSVCSSFAQAPSDPVAERMLLYQRDNGGWPQPGGNAINYNLNLSPAQQQTLLQNKAKLDATIDDKATTREINYLAEAARKTGNASYREAAERGIQYLLGAQKANGGWAQFYPDSSGYRKQITFNDNAMIDVLWVMKRTADRTPPFDGLDKTLVAPAQQAIAKGIDCILNTQYVQHGTRTAWCAQHDRITLLPTGARKFELPSLSGSETVGIVAFLMSLDNPSDRVKQAIQSAVAWLDSVRLVGIALKTISDPNLPKGRDVVVVPDSGSTLWARFYDLDTNRPFFSGRDGIKKDNLANIDYERRTGYGWYGTWPAKLLTKDYPKWVKKWGNNH